MDQRRFLAFLTSAAAILILWGIFVPPPKPPAKPAAKPSTATRPGDTKEAAPGVAADTAPAKPANEADQNEKAADLEAGAPPPALGSLPQVAELTIPTQFVTLGSIDPASGYRMMVTLTNEGAVLRRAEFASPRFRDQHDWSGYLGELELKNVESGVEVQAVGAGTPAALAQIQVGDVITGIKAQQETPIAKVDDFRTALARTRPGQEIELQVRGDDGNQTRSVRLIRKPLAVLRPEIDNYRMREEPTPPNFVDQPSFVLWLGLPDGTAAEGKSPPDIGKIANLFRSGNVTREAWSEAFPETASDTLNAAKNLAQLLEKGKWEIGEHDVKSASFRRPLPELGLEVVKRYTLEPAPDGSREDVNFPAYHLTMEIEVRNTADSAQKLSYVLDGPTGMPLEGWWYAHKISQRWFSAAGLRDVAVRFFGATETQIDCARIAKGEAESMGQGKALAYGGVDGQYFSAILLPKKDNLEKNWFETTDAVVVGPKPDARTPLTYTNVTCSLKRLPLELAPGEAHTDSYQVFIGPKRPTLLSQYKAAGDPNYSLKDLLYFGWPIFAAVAQLMLGILHFFYNIVGNFGIAIIMLTVLVRGLMFPISYKQTQSMARMQSLKPEMDKITERYKTDMQKRSQATQELYKKHGINPLAGCLPMFLQLPVFIGLYRALMVDVELRQSSLFGDAIRWCSNLAAPDMFFDWSGFMPDFITRGGLGLGPYLNLLPIVTVALFMVTQKMTMPEPTNEQAAMQQKMMKYMTLFMGFMFYKVAAGLCLYFIASSLWGIAERKMLPKPKPPGEAPPASGPTGAGDRLSGRGSKAATNGSPGQRAKKRR